MDNVTSFDVNSEIYKQLIQLIPDLLNLKPGEGLKSHTTNAIDLNLDILNRDEDIAKHFSVIRYFSEKEGVSAQAVIDRVKEDAKSFGIIHGFIDEWERVKTIRSPAIERLLTAKSRLDKATTLQNITIQSRGFETAVKILYRQEKLASKLKTIAPNLAQAFEKIHKPTKTIIIDWKSDKFDVEFDALRKANDNKLQYLAKFRDLLKSAKDKNQEKRLIQRLDTLTMDIFKSKLRQTELKKLVPNLASKLEALMRFKSQQKNNGRDF